MEKGKSAIRTRNGEAQMKRPISRRERRFQKHLAVWQGLCQVRSASVITVWPPPRRTLFGSILRVERASIGIGKIATE